MRKPREQLAIAMVHHDRGMGSKARGGEEGFEHVRRDRARNNAKEFAPRARDSSGEDDRLGGREAAGNNLDFFRKLRIVFQFIEVGAIGNSHICHGPALR